MPKSGEIISYLNSPAGEQYLERMYGKTAEAVSRQKDRFLQLKSQFESAFPHTIDLEIFSASGRTEVGGNHTDHNAGRVLAAAVNLDNLAVVGRNDENRIRVYSEGYPPCEIQLDQLAPQEAEKYSSAALIRGVCARLQELGFRVGGFDAFISGNVPKGSGLSSSAAYEVLIVTILSHLYNKAGVDPVLAAQIGQFAENHFFGKPCGLMDQTTSSVGGFVTIDFQDFKKPVVKKVDFDFAASGHALVIVDTGGHHADLNDEYAAVAGEMKAIARELGGTVLRQFSMTRLLESVPELRKKTGDRAILRALHFFADDQRVVNQVAALERNDFPAFLRLINESGRSSWMYLQNCYTGQDVTEQGVTLSLAITQQFLRDRGACRVHGGGFAGTIQAFVPNQLVAEYIEKMESFLGQGSCHQLIVRPTGAHRLEIN
jgi:galactokinase